MPRLILIPIDEEEFFDRIEKIVNRSKEKEDAKRTSKRIPEKEAASLIEKSPKSLSRYRKKGLIEYERIGSRFFYTHEALEAFVIKNRLKSIK